MRPYGRSSPGRSRRERRVRRLAEECARSYALTCCWRTHSPPWRRRARDAATQELQVAASIPSSACAVYRRRYGASAQDDNQRRRQAGTRSQQHEQHDQRAATPTATISVTHAIPPCGKVLPPSCTRAPGWAGVLSHTQPRRTHSRQPALKLTPGRHPFVGLPDRERVIAPRHRVQGAAVWGRRIGLSADASPPRDHA